MPVIPSPSGAPFATAAYTGLNGLCLVAPCP